MDAKNLLEKDSMQADAIRQICKPQAQPRQSACAIRISEHTIAKGETLTPRPLCDVSLNESRKIQFEFMPIALGVRTLNLAELALEARIHHLRGFRSSDPPDIAVVFGIKERKKRWEAVTVFEAEPAAMTDFECS